MDGYCMTYGNPIVSWTSEMKKKAKHVLTQLAIVPSMLQHDIHRSNFAIADCGHVSVLDMEQMKVEKDKKVREHYIKQMSRKINTF